MAYISWNSFQERYKASTGFVAKVSAKLPNGPHFDRKKKVLPTPYGLFREWLSKSLVGDWTTKKIPGGFVVCVAGKSDETVVSRKFGTIGAATNTSISDNTYQLRYQDSNYGELAKSLGYDI